MSIAIICSDVGLFTGYFVLPLTESPVVLLKNKQPLAYQLSLELDSDFLHLVDTALQIVVRVSCVLKVVETIVLLICPLQGTKYAVWLLVTLVYMSSPHPCISLILGCE